MNPFHPRSIATALTLVVMLVSTAARADVPDAGAPPWLAQTPAVQTSSSSSLPIGRMLVLLVVTGGLAGGAWYLRKRKLSPATGSGLNRLRVVDSTRIGAKAELVIASVNGRTMLLGVTEGSVRRLAWLDDDKPVEPVEPAIERDSFTGMLRSIIGEQGDAAEESPDDLPAEEPKVSRIASRQVDSFASGTVRGRAPAADCVEGQAMGLSNRRSRRSL